MATTEPIFSGTVSASMAAAISLLKPQQDWISIVLNVASVTGAGASVTFGLKWSMDGLTWAAADGTPDEFEPITAAGAVAKRFEVKAPYCLAYVNVSGDGASFTGSANAYL